MLHSISNVSFGHVYDDGINTNKRSSVVPSLINSIRWVSRTSHPHIYIESQTLYKVHAVNIYTRKKRRRRATILCAGCGSLQFVLTKRNVLIEHKNGTCNSLPESLSWITGDQNWRCVWVTPHYSMTREVITVYKGIFIMKTEKNKYKPTWMRMETGIFCI